MKLFSAVRTHVLHKVKHLLLFYCLYSINAQVVFILMIFTIEQVKMIMNY